MSRDWHLVVAFIVLGSCAFLCNAKLYRPHDVFTIRENIQIAEAQAWWQGRLDLPERKWDSALFEGRVFSHFPPAFSFLSALVVPFFNGVPHWLILLVIVAPIPLLAYYLMLHAILRSTDIREARGWSAFLALGLVCGTSALPVMEMALRGGSPYMVNQALAFIGLLIFLCEYFGRGRLWVAGVGVLIAVWSRQMSLAYLLPLGWMTWSGHRVFRAALQETRSSNGSRKLRLERNRISFAVRFGMFTLLAMGVPMALNWLKFGSPLESGYLYVYEGREEDAFARDARAHGLFSTWYVPRNLYYANLGFPDVHRIVRGERYEWYASPNNWGTGIWWTTPFLLYVIADWRRIVGQPRERMLLIAAGVAYIGLMLYHSTGFDQRGLNRYSLDYVPALFALAAPGSNSTPRRKCLTVGLIAWGVLYFVFARNVTNIRIW